MSARDLWIRPGRESPKAVWGLRQGIRVGLWPHSVEGSDDGGPRGLLRVGYPIREGGHAPGLVNFIAIEPIVGRARGFSELERGADGRSGREIVAVGGERDAGRLSRSGGRWRLSVLLRVEPFENGARPTVEMEFREETPDEVRLTVRAAAGSAAMRYCVLTATMGNYMRLRRLWLADTVVRPETLWPGFVGDEFTDEAFFSAARLARRKTGGLMVCATTDEANPGAAPADPRAPWWRYRGDFPLTQYWRTPSAGSATGELLARVNGRRLYWATHNPIPGGLAFENFDLLDRFRDGQTFIFGLSRRTPEELLRSG